MKRKNPRPPHAFHMPAPPEGTRPLGSGSTTVGRKKPAKAPRQGLVEQWLAPHIPGILKAAGQPQDLWTGTLLGAGSFGMVWQLADGRVFKLGFDYSESWFIHNLNVLVPDEFDMWDALPRIDYYQDLSEMPGWQKLLRGSGDPTFEGPKRDAGLFVCIREDVRSLKDFGAELVIHNVLTQSARETRTSVESADKLDDPYASGVVPNLREGLDFLEDFEINGDPKKIFATRTPTAQQWEAVEQAQLLIGPIVRLQRHLYNEWGVLLPDARGHNAGITLDSTGDREICVLRDLGFVYAPQYTEWDVTEALPLPLEE